MTALLDEAMFRMISDNFGGSIMITDPQLNILYINPAGISMSGYSADELLGQAPTIFKSGQTPDWVYRDLWQTLDAGRIWKGEFINRRKDGMHFLESKTISAIRDAQGEVLYYFAIGENMNLHQDYQQRIETLLALDPLTGLPNRKEFLRRLAEARENAWPQGMEFTIMHVDLDDFELINGVIGTDPAEQLIIEMGQRIRSTLRQSDQLGFLGNHEFCILLGPNKEENEASMCDVAERVLAAIRRPVTLGDTPVHATASLGIARYPADGDNAQELLNHAMSATKKARSLGGDDFCRFEVSTAQGLSSRLQLMYDLRQAIARNEMLLHFQPQVSLFSGAITGLEALIRWQHPHHGLIPPGEFIPLAEQGSQIIEIGEWVLHEACRQMRAWMDDGLPPLKIAINLAAKHLVLPELAQTITQALDAHRIDARMLEIEVTEGAMMQSVTAAIRSMEQLKDIGVRISLDDFGTGYSSLAYLSRFPVDVVKIDQSFVADITTNPVNAAIAQATIAMSHKLGKSVLAEGVETEEQMKYLRRNECDEIQGYFFSRPLPAQDIGQLLREGKKLQFSADSAAETLGTVLFVDDEINILSSIRRALRREGYRILTATSASEAFSLLAKNPVQVVISDQRMPEMNGTELLVRVKSMYPETVRMVLSGYSEISAVTDAINKGAVYRFMLKPWDDEKLKDEVASALRHWRELYRPDSDG